METSSPLAAIRQHHGGCRSNNAMLSGPASIFGSSGSLREKLHGKQRMGNDYMNVKGLRGSSPAASLAADLSQNFCLDNDSSPKFPTPRRSLFVANLTSGMDTRGYATTPPIPTSSPVHLEDVMDMSPPFGPFSGSNSSSSQFCSPSPATSGEDDDSEMSMMSNEPVDDSPAFRAPPVVASEQVRHNFVDRRRFNARRPSVSRAKGYSISSASSRFSNDDQLPYFKFGGDPKPQLPQAPAIPSPSDCFASESPSQQQKRPSSAESPCAVPFQGFSRRNQFNIAGGVPGRFPPGHARRQSNPFMRNRKQFRRSQSMFDAAGDVLKQDSAVPAPAAAQPVLAPVADVVETPQEPNQPALPHYFCDDLADRIPRITRETLVDVLDGKFNKHFENKIVIDCRFEYEYDGGHVDGAINYNDKELLSSHLFKNPMDGNTLLIFHCEFSAHRAPMMARHIRAEDRTANAASYPNLTYPEVYILDGGYKKFFTEHQDRCYPQAYIKMNDEGHINTCEREMDRLRNYRPGRKQIGRAATFAFGQNDESSPTAPPRPNRRSPITLASASPLMRLHSNRMPSF